MRRPRTAALQAVAHPISPPLLFVVAAIAASRIAVYAAGVRFDPTPLDYYWQIVEPELLRTRLLESLFYLHSQPPLFNLVLGLALKLFAANFDVAMHGLYLGLGLALFVGLYFVLTRVEIPSWPSAIVAAALAATPAALIYENWLFYEYPTAALLVLSAVALTAFLRRGSVALGVVFFSLVAAVVYVRSIFQVFWLLAALALLLLARRDLRRTTLLAVAPPLLAILLLVAKNAAVFGVLGTSSWWGMNLAQVVDSQVPQAERIQLVGEGKLSPVSAVDPFSPPRSYVRVVPPPRPRGVPVLDRLAKARGAPNMNNEILVRVSRDYAGDSFRLIRRRPGAYARAIVEGGKLYLRPTTDYEGLNRNREKIGRYERLFNQVFLLQRTERFDRICWAVLLAHLIALAYGLRLTYRLLRRRVEATVANTTLAYVWVTLAYATLVVTFAQVTENNRLRFFLDPLAVVLVAAAIRDAATRRAGRRPAAG